MSDSKSLLKEINDLKRRVKQLESGGVFDYEEWTAWTPTLFGATSNGTYTYNIREGLYYRIDDLIIFGCRFRVSGITVAGTGAARVSGLPYSNTGDVSFALSASSNANLTAGYSRIVAQMPLNLEFIVLIEEGDDVRQDYGIAGVAVNDLFSISGFYKATIP
jgi:hypothetical protein